METFMKLEHTVVDPRVRRYVWPVRVVWCEGISRRACAALLSEGRKPLPLKHDGTPVSFVLDFGRELHGGLQIDNGITPGHVPVRVRIRFGESVSEAMGETNNDHAIHDQLVQVPWYGATEVGHTGFRFVRIDMLDPGTELSLIKVRAVFLYRDLEYKGAFQCDDERLNQIWQTGAYTVHLCMQDMLWDGIKRDRLVWIGDMHPETMVINSVFGEVDIVPQSLDYVRDQTPLPRWMNGISSYSLWWILVHHAWFLYHGNRPYLEAQRAYLVRLLKQMSTQISPGGAEKMADFRFLDWPSSEDQAAVHAGLQALLVWAFDAGADLCRVLEVPQTVALCMEAKNRLLRYMPPPTPAKQANALLVLAGLADPQHINQTVLAADPLRGVSTFYGYYVLQARAKVGDYAGCLDVIRKYWGAMLDLGATTFWEDFNLDWIRNASGIDKMPSPRKKDIHADFGNYCYKGLRHSLCHGWAAGPTAWLTEHVLGVRPLAPGCRVLEIAPHLPGIKEVEGCFPTPKGIVTISHQCTRNGKIKTHISAPKGIRINQIGCQE